MYDINTHGDFKRYFDSTQKRNYWVLGYFGGGSVNIVDAYSIAQQMAATLNVPLNTIRIDEILHSRRYKGFKFIYSMVPNQTPDTNNIMDNVYAWLTD